VPQCHRGVACRQIRGDQLPRAALRICVRLRDTARPGNPGRTAPLPDRLPGARPADRTRSAGTRLLARGRAAAAVVVMHVVKPSAGSHVNVRLVRNGRRSLGPRPACGSCVVEFRGRRTGWREGFVGEVPEPNRPLFLHRPLLRQPTLGWRAVAEHDSRGGGRTPAALAATSTEPWLTVDPPPMARATRKRHARCWPASWPRGWRQHW